MQFESPSMNVDETDGEVDINVEVLLVNGSDIELRIPITLEGVTGINVYVRVYYSLTLYVCVAYTRK